MSEEAAQKSTTRVEVVVALLLGLAAVVTAWTSFQADQLSGQLQLAYSEGIRTADAASQAYNTAVASDVQDRALFLEFAKAAESGDETTALYVLETLMSPELAAAVDWWSQQPDDSGFDSPFVDENPSWSNQAFDEADALDDSAQEFFDQAQRLDRDGDKFELLSVVLAIALFFLGIAGLSRQRRVMIGLAVVGAAIVLFALVRALMLGDPGGVL